MDIQTAANIEQGIFYFAVVVLVVFIILGFRRRMFGKKRPARPKVKTETRLDVLVFNLPKTEPIRIIPDRELRLNYSGKIIDFRAGKMRVSDESTGRILREI